MPASSVRWVLRVCHATVMAASPAKSLALASDSWMWPALSSSSGTTSETKIATGTKRSARCSGAGGTNPESSEINDARDE